MFKSGSKKSEQEIDLHQEARLDKNQVNSGQLVTYIHLRVINTFCSVPDSPLTRPPGVPDIPPQRNERPREQK